MGTDSSVESTPNAPEFICPICLPEPKRFGFQWKKASLGVRSPCSDSSDNCRNQLSKKQKANKKEEMRQEGDCIFCAIAIKELQVSVPKLASRQVTLPAVLRYSYKYEHLKTAIDTKHLTWNWLSLAISNDLSSKHIYHWCNLLNELNIAN